MDAISKIRLLGSIFPEMIEFDGIKCRTPRINEAVLLCFNADEAFRGKRKGTIHQKIELSLLVAHRLSISNRLVADFNKIYDLKSIIPVKPYHKVVGDGVPESRLGV